MSQGTSGPKSGDPKPVDAAAKVRHDIRTPVSQILGYSELLQEEAEETGQASLAADLKKIHAAATRLLKLLDEHFPGKSAAPSAPAAPVAAPVLFKEGAAPPVTAPPPEAPEPAKDIVAPVTALGGDAAAGPGRILVVDDNEMNRDMLSRRLAGKGYSVTVAEDGHAALRLIDEQPFDAVLLDVMMPGLSGFEVLTRLRATFSRSDLPVIMATARDQSEDVVEALRLGANDYVTKPLDFAVVLARLESQLALKRQKEKIESLAGDLEKRNSFIQRTFGRYLSEDVVSALLDTPEGLQLGGERRKVTILMSDLRGFTAISEATGPEQVVRLLNTYLGVMAEVIQTHQGMIDEFIGDAILAIFGAPIPRPDDARRAVSCAIKMQLAVKNLNTRLEVEGLPRIEMGVALHTGEVVVGNIGSERRAKYGVVGSPVNHTGRIESFTVGGQVLVSEITLREAGEGIKVGERLVIDAKGAREPIVVYDLRGMGEKDELALPDGQEALRPLPTPIPVRYQLLEGKSVAGGTFDGSLREVSASGALLQTSRPLRSLSNLKMKVLPPKTGSELCGDLYAKVVEVRAEAEGLARLRFTSVPSDVEACLKALLEEEPGGEK
jgi:class 3 adenylate cyclase/CheY-like chemotaxis protein